LRDLSVGLAGEQSLGSCSSGVHRLGGETEPICGNFWRTKIALGLRRLLWRWRLIALRNELRRHRLRVDGRGLLLARLVWLLIWIGIGDGLSRGW